MSERKQDIKALSDILAKLRQSVAAAETLLDRWGSAVPSSPVLSKVVSPATKREPERCMAINTSNKKRCSSKASTKEGDDPELCRRHNHAKLRPKVKKIDLDEIEKRPKQAPTLAVADDKPVIEEVQITVRPDEDKHYVDIATGDIYDYPNDTIIGKKDLKTGKKVFF